MANHMKGLRSISCHTRMKPAHKQMTRGLRYETQHYLLSNIISLHDSNSKLTSSKHQIKHNGPKPRKITEEKREHYKNVL